MNTSASSRFFVFFFCLFVVVRECNQRNDPLYHDDIVAMQTNLFLILHYVCSSAHSCICICDFWRVRTTPIWLDCSERTTVSNTRYNIRCDTCIMQYAIVFVHPNDTHTDQFSDELVCYNCRNYSCNNVGCINMFDDDYFFIYLIPFHFWVLITAWHTYGAET